VTYTPSLAETILVLASFCNVGLLLLIFGKIFPLIPVWEQKEAQVFAQQVQVGKRTVQALIKE
jgi:hypothetical protein